ncbi:MAG: hypothetical protein ACI9FN_002376, partial [Saprospiraceae bacterium]
YIVLSSDVLVSFQVGPNPFVLKHIKLFYHLLTTDL